MIDESSFEHVIFVGEENSKEYLESFVEDVQKLDFKYFDLCEESKNIVMKYQMNFQGEEIFFEDFVKGFDDEIFGVFEIENLLRNIPEIGSLLDKNENYFVKQKIVDGEKLKDLEDFIEEIYKNERKDEEENFSDILESNEVNSENFFSFELRNSAENEIEDDAIAKSFKSTQNVNEQKRIKNINKENSFRNVNKENFAKIKMNNNLTQKISKQNFTQNVNNENSTQIVNKQNSTQNVNKQNSLNISEKLTQKLESEVFIVSSPHGSGKSVLLKEIALEIKKISPSKWIILIDLEETFQELQKSIEKNNSSYDNLTDKEIILFLIQNEDESSQKFLTKFLEFSEKVVLIFDNFDKVENSTIILNFINQCKKFSSQIWVATQPHQESFLINKFKNAKVIKISPLNHKTHESFLEYFSHLDENDEKNLIEFVEMIEVKEVQLLHEIVENWSENSYKMFKKILSKRYEKFKVKILDDFEENLSFKLRLHKEHQKIALKSINLREINYLKIIKENFNIKSEEIFNFGIIYKNKNQRNFNEIFRQFYIAQFIIENLTKVESDEKAEKLLVEIFKRKNQEKYKMVVKFLDDFVKLSESGKNVSKIKKILL
jgi:hypothetical protein